MNPAEQMSEIKASLALGPQSDHATLKQVVALLETMIEKEPEAPPTPKTPVQPRGGA